MPVIVYQTSPCGYEAKVITSLTDQFCIDRNGDEGWTSCDEAGDFMRRWAH